MERKVLKAGKEGRYVFLTEEINLSGEPYWIDLKVEANELNVISGYIKNQYTGSRSSEIILASEYVSVNEKEGWKKSLRGYSADLPNVSGICPWTFHIWVPKGVQRIKIGFRSRNHRAKITLGSTIRIQREYFLKNLSDAIDEFNGKVSSLEDQIAKFSSEWKEISRIPYTRTIEARSQSIVTVRGKIKTQPEEKQNAALLKVEFPNLLLDREAIGNLGLMYSDNVGGFVYLPTAEKNDEWEVSFIMPESCSFVRLTWMSWYSKFPIEVMVEEEIHEQKSEQAGEKRMSMDPVYRIDTLLPLKQGYTYRKTILLNEKSRYEIRYKIEGISSRPYPAIVKFRFFDKDDYEIKAPVITGLGISEAVGYYKYIPVSENWQKAFFLPPPASVRFEIIFAPWTDFSIGLLNHISIIEHPAWGMEDCYTPEKNVDNADLTVAVMCDKKTEDLLGYDYNLIRLESRIWEKQIDEGHVDALLVEPPGEDNHFSNKKVEHITKIVEVCRQKGIKTIFYNQDDSLNYSRCIEIAKKFDFILTASSTYMDCYKRDCGHENVFSISCAVQPKIHNPIGKQELDEFEIGIIGENGKNGFGITEMAEHGNWLEYNMFALSGDRMLDTDRSIVYHHISLQERAYLYKIFKVFLDTDSKTDLGQATCEIMASSTPFITVKPICEGIASGIAETNMRNTSEHLESLLQDNWLRHRTGHLSYRAVMGEYTVKAKFGEFFKAIGLNRSEDETLPKVSIVVPTNRIGSLQQIKKNIACQKYSNLEGIIVLHNDVFDIDAVKEYFSDLSWVTVLQVPQSASLGECLNISIDISSGKYWLKMDDDDLYFESYVTDLILPFSYSDAKIVGKEATFIYLRESNKLFLKYPDRSHRYEKLVRGATMAVERSVFDTVRFSHRTQGEDSAFLKMCQEYGYKIYSADPYNYVTVRYEDKNQHTWKISDDELVAGAVFVADGLALEQVEI